jgi:hypothetical protein
MMKEALRTGFLNPNVITDLFMKNLCRTKVLIAYYRSYDYRKAKTKCSLPYSSSRSFFLDFTMYSDGCILYFALNAFAK